MDEVLHRLKARVLRRPRLHAALRRHVLAPYQRRQLGRVARLVPVDREAVGPTILVLALRPWAISRAWELVVSRLLRQEGCRVVWAHCDRVAVRCDAMMGEAPDPSLCAHCHTLDRDASASAGVERVSLADLVDVDHDAALARARREDGAEDPALDRASAASLARILARAARPVAALSAAERGIRDELVASASLVRAAAAPLLDRVRPDAVLALNGKFYAEALILAEAERRGVATWTYERGNRRDTIVLASRRTAIPFATEAIVADLAARPLSAAEGERIDAYLRERVRVGNGQVRFVGRGARPAVGLRAGAARLVALFTNLVWDSSVVGEDTIFASMADWIDATVRELATRPEVRLAIRIHPAEDKVYWHRTRDGVEAMLAQRFPHGLPPNVTVIRPSDPLDSYDLMREADLVLVYTSTVGMEAAASGKRVVAAARSSYAAAPFVVRPASADRYRAELRALATAPPTPDAAELARRFMHRLYFEEMLPVPQVTEDPTGFRAGARAAPDGLLVRRLRALLAERRRRPA